MKHFLHKKEAHPGRTVLYKFVLLCTVMVGYFLFLTYQYDLLTGGITSAITWSFFVLCTPVADAGFLLDFPIRLLFGIRMLLSEVFVWALAILVNVISLHFFAEYYQTTELTRIFYLILTNPYPYWAVVLLSGLGTFLSIRFADELMDVVRHRDREYFHLHGLKHEIIIIVFLIFVLFGYYELVSSLGIEANP